MNFFSIHFNVILFLAKFQAQDKPSETTPAATTPRKNVHAKAALFANATQETSVPPSPEKVQQAPKQLDQSKTAFLTQTSQQEVTTQIEKSTNKLDQSKTAFLIQKSEQSTENVEKVAPKQLDQTKIAQFNAQNNDSTMEKTATSQVCELELNNIFFYDCRYFLILTI